MRIGIRHELAAEVTPRYLGANRKEKGRILDEFCAASGYSRWYAIEVLEGRRQRRPARRRRTKRYGAVFQSALKVLWEASGYICAERLKAVLAGATGATRAPWSTRGGCGHMSAPVQGQHLHHRTQPKSAASRAGGQAHVADQAGHALAKADLRWWWGAGANSIALVTPRWTWSPTVARRRWESGSGHCA